MWDVQRDDIWITVEGRRFFGWGDTEPINLPRFLDRLHAEDREPVRQAINLTLEQGKAYAAEYRVLEHDGNYHWISAQGEVEFDQARKPLRMRGVAVVLRSENGPKRAEAEGLGVAPIFENRLTGMRCWKRLVLPWVAAAGVSLRAKAQKT
jgi:PAS domain-containing protein